MTARARLAGAGTWIAALSLALEASAEEQAGDGPLAGSRGAVELTSAAGYVRVPGTYGGALPGGGPQGASVEGSLGLRGVRWSACLQVQLMELVRERGEDIRSTKGGLGVAYHFLPAGSIDPWLSASAGYRVVTIGASSSQGFEVLRLTMGSDVRMSSFLAVGPMASVGVDVFPWLLATDAAASREGTARWYTSALFGLQGRFDLSPDVIGD